MRHIVFDLDGTLADCTHRVPLLPDWDVFYAACGQDSPIETTVEIYKVLRQHFLVDVWSGRRETEYDRTWDWFHQHDIPWPRELKMRPDGDHRPDTELKSQWLDEAEWLPNLVFEDRASVVQMYRARGVLCYQVADGNF